MAGPTTQNPYAPVPLRPAAGGTGHPAMARNRSPQSGGDIGGPKRLPYNFRDGALHNYGMTRMAKAAEKTQKAPRMPHHPAHSNAAMINHGSESQWGKHPKGNSMGKAEMLEDFHDGHITDTISKMAKSRLTRPPTNERLARGDEYSAQPFRRSSGAFGPVRDEYKTKPNSEHERRGMDYSRNYDHPDRYSSRAYGGGRTPHGKQFPRRSIERNTA